MASTRSILGIYVHACRPYAFLLSVTLLLYGIGAFLSTTGAALIFRWLVNTIDTASDDRVTLFHAALIPLGFLLLNGIGLNVAYRMADFLMTRGQAAVIRDLTAMALTALRQHSLTFFENAFTGALVAKSRRFVLSFETLHDKFVFGFFMLGVHLVAATVALFLTSHVIGLVFIVWSLCFIVISYELMLWRRATDMAESDQNSIVTGALSDILTNIRSVQANAAGDREDALYGQVIEEEWRRRIRAVDRHSIVYAIQGVLVTALEVPLLYISLRAWFGGGLSLADLVLQQSLVVACGKHMWDLGRSMKDFARAIASASEFVDILEQPQDVVDAKNKGGAFISTGAVRFSDVSFRYGTGPIVLEHFMLDVAPGERIGIVGRSGAGKTTLTKLLLRFVDPSDGAVTIDGHDLRSLKLDALRRAIGFVPQDPMLFHRSLRENIAYAKPDATQAEIEAAAKKAHIHEVIVALPKGYDTLVGERGVKLSGGERQRVLLARVFLQDPAVILLDEPTSALDSESERIVQENLRELIAGRTTLAIAHRISTVKAMDRIIVLEKGAILEEGTHDALLAKKGFYAQLWDHQVNGFLPENE